jgi:hypothetical protein
MVERCPFSNPVPELPPEKNASRWIFLLPW